MSSGPKKIWHLAVIPFPRNAFKYFQTQLYFLFLVARCRGARCAWTGFCFIIFFERRFLLPLTGSLEVFFLLQADWIWILCLQKNVTGCLIRWYLCEVKEKSHCFCHVDSWYQIRSGFGSKIGKTGLHPDSKKSESAHLWLVSRRLGVYEQAAAVMVWLESTTRHDSSQVEKRCYDDLNGVMIKTEWLDSIRVIENDSRLQ